MAQCTGLQILKAVGSNPTRCSSITESWPSGRRHLPAKEAYGLKPVSRVRIPRSPPGIIKSKVEFIMSLITLGCSITSLSGWKEKIASTLAVPLINLSQSAGSNTLQIQRLHEYIINNSLVDQDIIIWQITAPRFSQRLVATVENAMLAAEIQKTQFGGSEVMVHYSSKSINFFDDQRRIDILCNSPLINDHVRRDFNDADELESVLATLILLKKFHPRLLVFLGWHDVINRDFKEKFFAQLTKNQIDFVADPLVDWVKRNNLPFDDSLHPKQESHESYALNVLLPQLDQLGWIDRAPIV